MKNILFILILFSNMALSQPYPEKIIAYYDGTINFTTRKIVAQIGSDITINSLDWESYELSSGIPIKTISTFTFPDGYPLVGGLTLPSISLPQNYDVANQIFCKWENQILGDSLQEITPAKISKIVIYDHTMSGDSLNTIRAYFSIPLYVTNYTVCAAGCDYTTIDAAITGRNAGDTIIVKSGTYTENNSTTKSLYITKAQVIIGVGNVNIKRSAGATDVMRLNVSGAFISGLNCDGENAPANGIRFIIGGSTVDRCKITGATTYNTLINGTTCRLKRSVIAGAIIPIQSTGCDVQECIINNSAGSYGIGIIGAGNLSSIAKYNKITGNGGIKIYINKSGDCTIFNNTFKNIITRCVADIGTGFTGILDIRRNIFILPAYNSEAIRVVANNFTTKINYNEFKRAQTSVNMIVITNVGHLEVIGNTVDSVKTFLNVTSTGIESTCHINYNRINSIGSTNYTLMLGTEGGDAYNDKITANIVGNYISGTGSAVNTNHAIFIGHNSYINVKYNYITETGYGIVVKYLTANNGTGDGIKYNIFKNNVQNVRIKGNDNLFCVNNTIVGDSTTYNISMSDNSLNLKLLNNIIISSSTKNNLLIDALTGLNSNYNIWYNQTINGGTFAVWKGLGYDYDSYNTNPNLSSQYKPIEPSNAIGSGVNLGSLYNIGLNIFTSNVNIMYSNQYAIYDIGAIVVNKWFLLKSDNNLLKSNSSLLKIR